MQEIVRSISCPYSCRNYMDLKEKKSRYRIPLSQVPTLWCDNVSTISLASNPVFHARTKHMKIDYHFIKGLVLAHFLNVHYVSGQHQIVDIHTKSLKAKIQYHQSKLSLGSHPFSLKGCKKTPHRPSQSQHHLESKSYSSQLVQLYILV